MLAAADPVKHVLLIPHVFRRKVQNGKEVEIQTALKKSKVSELELPEKLWTVIQASGPWFNIEE
ncbi:hypothetical protein CHH92_18165 [Bacillus sonorensis]|uniref:NADH-dependent flavin oxidoreductase, oye family protein n=1 Tax=Bacillus sonorensis L12 TaxID=1274524 RepID=M5P8E5_9BACI|nr:NADH-dependent flavin oxidoreductase, oye family protein [Bacillus sonorensis L12]PAD58773.1 hypothetical protein CHH92_18165 [Bacillus sonorensis]